MAKKQNENKETIDLKFFLIVLLILVVSFVILVPKISSTIFPQKRAMILDSFLEKVKNSKSIDSQEFWKFREFYSPGHFVFNKDGLSENELKNAREKINLPVNEEFIERYFSSFSSAHLTSLETFTTTNEISKIIDLDKLDKRETVFSSEREITYKDNEDRLIILFIKPISEMERANGFFDYDDKDKELVEGKYWLQISVINDN